MGTRSLTVFYDNDGEEIAVMYRQHDGYPTGHGADLLDWGKDRYLVNGFNGADEALRAFNGMGCAAADCLSYFKDGIGSIYLYPAGTRNCGEDFIYELYPIKDFSALREKWRLFLKVTDEKNIYEGYLDDFNPEEVENKSS